MKVIISAFFCLLAASQIQCRDIAFEPRLIGVASTNKYVAAIFNSDATIVCSGAIIDPLWVLTSASCLSKLMDVEIRIQFKDELKFEEAESVSDKNIHFHPSFNPTTLANDIALVELINPIERTARVVKVATTNVNLAGKVAIVSGFGIENRDATAIGALRQRSTVILDNASCQKHTISSITANSNAMCTWDSIGCKGDQGGPLVYEGKLVGIISMTEQQMLLCDAVNPLVKVITYTRVNLFTKWITSVSKLNLM